MRCLAPIFFVRRCARCQRATGSAFATNVWFADGSIEFSLGGPNEFVRVALSAQLARHGSCQSCASPIGVRAGVFAGIHGFSVGSFDNPAAIKPNANVWLKWRLPWGRPIDEIPGYGECIDAGGTAKLTSP